MTARILAALAFRFIGLWCIVQGVRVALQFVWLVLVGHSTAPGLLQFSQGDLGLSQAYAMLWPSGFAMTIPIATSVFYVVLGIGLIDFSKRLAAWISRGLEG